MATTTNYGWTKPTVNGSSGTWGTILNTLFDAVDTALFAVAGSALQKTSNLSDLSSVSTARTNLGLGGMATQAPGSVAITGGSVTGITDIAIADGGTGASTAADARTNLGLGTASTMTGPAGTIVGTTDAQTLTNKTINGGSSSASAQASSETSGSLTSDSANKVVVCSGGVTLTPSSFTAGTFIILIAGSSARTLTRGGGAMYVNGVDASTATLGANQIGVAYVRTTSIIDLGGAVS